MNASSTITLEELRQFRANRQAATAEAYRELILSAAKTGQLSRDDACRLDAVAVALGLTAADINHDSDAAKQVFAEEAKLENQPPWGELSEAIEQAKDADKALKVRHEKERASVNDRFHAASRAEMLARDAVQRSRATINKLKRDHQRIYREF